MLARQTWYLTSDLWRRFSVAEMLRSGGNVLTWPGLFSGLPIGRLWSRDSKSGHSCFRDALDQSHGPVENPEQNDFESAVRSAKDISTTSGIQVGCLRTFWIWRRREWTAWQKQRQVQTLLHFHKKRQVEPRTWQHTWGAIIPKNQLITVDLQELVALNVNKIRIQQVWPNNSRWKLLWQNRMPSVTPSRYFHN